MDKILSARVDESVIRRIGVLASQLGTTKKAIIESAIRMYAEMVEKKHNLDVFEQTHGTWRRAESPDKTVKKTREAFRRSMHRYQK